MGSPIQMMLAQAAARPAASAVQPSMEQLCKDAGTNQRKRDALGCPPIEGTVNNPNVPAAGGTETPNDPDIGVVEESNEPTVLDLAIRKQEMKLPLTEEEQAAIDIYMKQRAAEQAAAPPAEPSLWESAIGWMKGLGK